MIITIDSEKLLGKIHHQFLVKIFTKPELEGKFLTLIKELSGKHTLKILYLMMRLN